MIDTSIPLDLSVTDGLPLPRDYEAMQVKNEWEREYCRRDDLECTAKIITNYVPREYRHAETDVQPILDWFEAPKDTLYVYGPVGAGKTHACFSGLRILLAKRLLRGGHIPPGPMFYGGGISGLLNKIKDSYSVGFASVEDYEPMQAAENCGLLLLDDLGTAKLTEWGNETLGRIIDYRREQNLPVVAISNLTPGELRSEYDERLISRLGQDATIVFLNRRDYRSRGQQFFEVN